MLLLLTAGTGIGLSGDLPPEMLLLARFKQKVRQDVGRLANCTCLETIERSGREPGTDSFQFLDRVRLEVTTAGEKELLTWPGGAHFEDWAVTAFVKSGLVASGMFASHARNLFLRDGATFQYGGPEEVEGRSAVRYDFKVSRLASLYRLRTASGAATVATKGSFWFDAGSLELIRLDEFADQIPEELGLTGALTRVRYGRITDAVPGVLLPQSAEVELRHSSGELRRNKIEFAQCREYRAESSISFGATELTPEAARSEPARVDLPAGLTVKMELESGFDSATAAIGDPVRARVIENVRRSGKTIIPKGAIVTGRIRSMERQPRAGGFLLGIEFTVVRWENERAEFRADLLGASATGIKSAPGAAGGANSIIPLAGTAPEIGTATPVSSSAQIRVASAIPGVGRLLVKGEHWRLAPGLRMAWRTVTP